MNLDPRILIGELGPTVLAIVGTAVLLFVVVLAGVVAVAHRATRWRQANPGVVDLQRRARTRRSLVWTVAALVVGLAVSGAVVLVRSAPTRAIPVPPATASPEEVVQAYLDASTAHDVETMNALVDQARLGTKSRFEPTWVVRDVRVSPSTGGDGEGEVFPGGEIAKVDVSMFMVEGHSLNFPDDTETSWGYWLLRTAPDQPWRIVDQGH